MPIEARPRFRGRLPFRELLVVIALLVTGGCDQAITAPSPDDLSGRWRVVELSSTVGALVPSSDVRLEVEFNADRLSVRADCNTCVGGFTSSGASISVGPMACTRAACPNMVLADRFVSTLQASTSIVTYSGFLELAGASGSMRLAR